MTNMEKYLTLLNDEVDGLLLTSRYARHYGAEFDIAEGVAIVSKKGSRYFVDFRYIESAQKNLKHFEVLDINQFTGFIGRLKEAIADFGITTLGYEDNYITAAELHEYQAALGVKFVPMGKEISSFRGTKERWELDLMLKAQEITDKAFTEVLPRIKPGMTELELQAELIYCLYKNGAMGLSFSPIVVSGPNTSLPHGVAGERVLQAGDFITLDFGVLYHGYCSDMTRTVALGYATEEMKEVYATVLKAQTTAIAATKAGMVGRDIDAVARKVITDAGYGPYFGHGYGHGLGLEIHEQPNTNPGNPNPMPAGAICSAEPGIYLPGKFGVRIEDVVIITEEGAIDITKSPKELIVIPV